MFNNPFDMISNSSINFTFWMSGTLILYPLIKVIASSFSENRYRIAIYFIASIGYFSAFMYANSHFLDALLSGLVIPSIIFVSSVIVFLISLYIKNEGK